MRQSREIPTELDPVLIGRQLKMQRIQAGLTQEQLGEALGVTAQMISNWESGHVLVNLTRLVQLSKYYDVDINLLLGETYSNVTPQMLISLIAVAVDGLPPQELEFCAKICQAVADHYKAQFSS